MDAKYSEKIKKSQASRHEIGISWRLFGILMLYILFTIAVIWLFQVLLVGSFYKESKRAEFVYTEEAIISCIESGESIEDTVFRCSSNYDQCILVFKESDEGIMTSLVGGACVDNGCLIHHLNKDAYGKFYEKAKVAGGTYTAFLNPPSSEGSENKKENGAVYISIYTASDGETEYMILLNTEFTPFNSMVKTIEKQFGWIIFILILGAIIVVGIISKSVCTPMQRMSASARKLATGDYTTEFQGGGYRESQELADALNYAAQELAKSDNLQKELVANISHDLRTPLTMIKGYSEVMRDIPDENTPENVQVIIDETERLTELVNDMLDLSKLRAGTRKPEFEIFDLTDTVREVFQRYTKLVERDGYRIDFISDRNVMINADKTMILQVIYNLINNAVNYTGEDKTVTVTQSVAKGKVRITVSDTGKGIAAEDLPLIWDRYYKVDKVHKRATVGTGLGLSIVKGILEAHNATYGVESKLGEGSSFWFELSVCEDKQDVGYIDSDFVK